MKKNIIIAAIAAASALLLSVSCQKESQPESQNGINGGAKTFTATIEQGLTKTTITNDHKVNWTTTDKININGKSYTASPKTDDATKADFTADGEEATPDGSNKYKAIYPSTLYVTDHFALPATQTYTAGEFNAPMYAQSTTQTLSFKNICAVLAITVTSADIPTLKSIKVKSDKAMCGTFTVTDNKAGLTDATDATKAVELVSSSVLTLDETGTTFYIAIPAQEYSYLKIFLSEDGTLYKRAMITKKAAGLGPIACNTIYNIAYETNAVQMYAGGPYWSTMNVGATAVTGTDSYGTYFAWGDVTGQEASTKTGTSPIANAFTTGFSWSNCPWTNGTYDGFLTTKVFTKYVPEAKKSTYGKDGTFFDDKITLDLADDAATVNWGAAWKMPTGGDTGLFKDLKDNTNSSWTDNYNSTDIKGRTFTGKDSFSDITLFFPAAGNGSSTSLSDAGSNGYYWSSSLRTSNPNTAYILSFASGSVGPQSNGTRCLGFSVRPVSD